MRDDLQAEQDELTPEQETELQDDLKILLAEHEELLARESNATDTVDLDQPIGRLSRMDAIQQQKMAQEQRRRLELRRSQVRQAIGWLNEGDYGLCRRCEEPIGFRRLKARPESPFCLSCRSAIEQRGS